MGTSFLNEGMAVLKLLWMSPNLLKESDRGNRQVSSCREWVLADTVKVIEGRDWSVETGEGGGRASHGCMGHWWMLVIGNFKTWGSVPLFSCLLKDHG